MLRALRQAGALCVNEGPAPPAETTAASLAAAVEASAAQKAAVVYDVDALRANFALCNAAFASSFVHALSVKTAPLAFMVREAVAAGLGVECASFGECASALALGCKPEHVLFDSPAKTVPELRWALEVGITVNADNLVELERIEALIAERSARGAPPSASVLGFRINPIVAGGEIACFAVSTPDSKFGHPIHTPERREAVVGAFRRYAWLSALMVHTGSAGTSLPMLATGARTLVDLADEIDASLGSSRVTTLDIGGGLAASLSSDVAAPTFDAYAAELRVAAPSLFDGRRRIFTEFGRALTAKSGWVVTQVEYVKEHASPESGEPRTAICQAGADLLMREAYTPTLPSVAHRISAYDAEGNAREPGVGATPHNLAGPLCFAGDYIRKGAPLPPLCPGDYVVVHDAGADSTAHWSRHCSRL